MGFIVMAVFMGIIGIIGTLSLNAIKGNAHDMYHVNFQNMDNLHRIKENLLQAEAIGNAQQSRKEESEREKWGRKIAELNIENQGIMEIVEPRLSSEAERRAWRELKEAFEARLIQTGKMKHLEMGYTPEHKEGQETIRQYGQDIIGVIDFIIGENKAAAQAQDEDNVRRHTRTQITMIIIILIGLMVAFSVSVYLSSYVKQSLKTSLDFIKALGKGDMKFKVEDSGAQDEFGLFITTLKQTQGKMKRTMAQISSDSQEISTHSDELLEIIGHMNSVFNYVARTTPVLGGGMQVTRNTVGELLVMVGKLGPSEAQEEILLALEDIAYNMDKATVNSDAAKRGMSQALEVLDKIAIASDSQAIVAERLRTLMSRFKI